MKRFISKYGGILFGASYGLIMRLAFGMGAESLHIYAVDLFSITFVWIVPIVMGIIPMLAASRQQLESRSYRIRQSMLAVLLFFIFCFMSRLEDIICILIIAIPFLAAAALSGLIVGELISNYRRRNELYSVLLIPLLAATIEARIPAAPESYEVTASVVVDAAPEAVWAQVIRVPQMGAGEYRKGFFHYAGIPAPLYAELSRDTLDGVRTGHFEGGLMFRETVTAWRRNREVAFDIRVIPSSIRKTIFEQHLLKGSHFRFLGASYSLRPLNGRQTSLSLSCSYELDTRINAYGAWWGRMLLSDFEERLLAVIKRRSEAQ